MWSSSLTLAILSGAALGATIDKAKLRDSSDPHTLKNVFDWPIGPEVKASDLTMKADGQVAWELVGEGETAELLAFQKYRVTITGTATSMADDGQVQLALCAPDLDDDKMACNVFTFEKTQVKFRSFSNGGTAYPVIPSDKTLKDYLFYDYLSANPGTIDLADQEMKLKDLEWTVQVEPSSTNTYNLVKSLTTVSWGKSLAGTFFAVVANPDSAWLDSVKKGEFKWDAKQYLAYYDDKAGIKELDVASVKPQFAAEDKSEKDGSSLPFAAATLGTVVAYLAMINF